MRRYSSPKTSSTDGGYESFYILPSTMWDPDLENMTRVVEMEDGARRKAPSGSGPLKYRHGSLECALEHSTDDYVREMYPRSMLIDCESHGIWLMSMKAAMRVSLDA